MFSRFIIILTLIILPLFSYSFPEVEKFSFFGSRVFSPKNQLLGYTINHFGRYQKKEREEFYDAMGLILKYKTFIYDDFGNVVREIEFDRNRYPIKEVSYKYKNNKQIDSKIVKQGSSIHLVKYYYQYYKKIPKVRTVDEVYYKANISGQVKHRSPYVRVLRTVYRYKNLGKRLDHYVKLRGWKSFKYLKGELFKFHPNGSIDEIVRISKHKRPFKYIKYFYDEVFKKISKIDVYKIQARNRYKESTGNYFPTKNITLKNTFLYDYNSENYSRVNKLILPGDLEKRQMRKEKVEIKVPHEDDDSIENDENLDEEDRRLLREEDMELDADDIKLLESSKQNDSKFETKSSARPKFSTRKEVDLGLEDE